MERSHSLEFQAMRAAPVKKLPARPGVSSPSVPILHCGAERRLFFVALRIIEPNFLTNRTAIQASLRSSITSFITLQSLG
jgi:hypothetical protein